MLNSKPMQSSQPTNPSMTASTAEVRSPQQYKFGLGHIFGRLNIYQKIGSGYALGLGIAVLGSTAGLVTGDHYQQMAIEKHEVADQEISLLYRLQTGILQARTHQQQFIPLLKEPKDLREEHDHFLEHAAEIQQTWSEIQAYINNDSYQQGENTDGIPGFLKDHEGLSEAYFREIKALLKQFDATRVQPQNLATAQAALLNFTNSPTALGFDSISDDLKDVIKASREDLEKVEQQLQQAQQMRLQIVVSSILLSITIAVLLAIYTSRAIARPIKQTTEIAQRVTRESNFDLQAPVTTTDEVGLLADSLNQLIQQVKGLLEEQKAEAARQLIQSEKMSSLGRMLAGVAHEINNPVNFIYGNLEHTNNYFQDLLELIQAYETKASDSDIADLVEDIDLEFLREDLPKSLQSMKLGADRVRQIVLSLKNFSRLDETEAHPVDLHACIDSTLLILNNRVKKGITIIRNYGDLPKIPGYAGSLYQVFMNILSNAMDALEGTGTDLSVSEIVPQITITTELQSADRVVIKIADNGPGIDPEHLSQIFETFFTTKPMGVGTGLGLSISYQIVVEKHGGELLCHSQLGEGTTFEIILPTQQHTIAQSPEATLVPATR